jgi:transcription initiation factor TFIIIB Brf1 subunit/transcription initiation factor TFIIB
MKRTSHIDSVRPLADSIGVSSETTEIAADIERIVTHSGETADSLPSAVAAGCLYVATLAVDGGITADTRHRPPPNRNWNPQVMHNRSDNGSAETTICKAASITPASLRKHSREAAAVYLDSDAEMVDSRARERLSRLTLR